MSLINQVLKDIEKRRKQVQPAKQDDIADIFTHHSKSHYKWQIMLGVFIMSLILGVASWWWWPKSKQTTALTHGKKISTILKSRPQNFMTKIKLPLTQKQIVDIHYQRALKAVREGKYEEAIRSLIKIVKAAPSYPLVRQQLVILLMKQNRIAEAQQWLAHGIEHMPNYVPFIELKARILFMRGQAERALDALRTVSPNMIQYPEYYVMLADVEQQLGNYRVSASLYERLLRYDSSNSYWWMGLGISLEKIGQRNLAISAYTKALSTGNLNFNLTNYVQSRLYQLRGLTS